MPPLTSHLSPLYPSPMPTALTAALEALALGTDLSAAQASEAFGVIMRGEATPAQIAGLLLGLRAKGETYAEIAGAAQALRDAMVTVPLSAGPPVVDTCGTGGGTVGTFNISTAAAFVVAGAGARVAKHGNRSYTSKCGSADVLEALGIDLSTSAEAAGAVLNAAGVVFLFAPNFHPAMRHVGPTRKELGVPTVMNLLGPLANPAGVRRQVIGVADPTRAPRIASAVARLGADHALVVHAEVGMDEISPAGITQVWEVRGEVVSRWTIDPVAYGLEWADLRDLAGQEPAENARRIEDLLGDSATRGNGDEAGRRVVVLNAAAGIYVAGLAPDFATAVQAAYLSLSSGKALRALSRLKTHAGRLDG